MPASPAPPPAPKPRLPLGRWLMALSIGLWLVIIVLSLLPGEERPHTGFSGNVEHFVAYAGTAGITALGFAGPAVSAIVLGFSAASGLFEIAQLFIPGRTSGLDNWFASTLGALAGALAARRVAAPLLALWFARR
ncbi:VanZ family protein [Xanthobacter sp. KR7-65]|uniref:VanZ family protein n=1 Tax=Xanthobacter sp. KR7-65 TaxID=3156612 RepID=UPI0032B4782E